MAIRRRRRTKNAVRRSKRTAIQPQQPTANIEQHSVQREYPEINDIPIRRNMSDQENKAASSPNRDIIDDYSTSIPLDTSGPAGSRVLNTKSDALTVDEEESSAWGIHALIKAGYLTSTEAAQYLEYFYDRLQPMSPVTVCDIRLERHRIDVLSRESFLISVILAIASRFMELRSTAKHFRIWEFCSLQIQILLNPDHESRILRSETNAEEYIPGVLGRSGDLRTIATVEGLLLLSVWQIQSMKNVSGSDTGSCEPIAATLWHNQESSVVGTDDTRQSTQLEDQRSYDLSSWSLLHIAHNLSKELDLLGNGCGNSHCGWSPNKNNDNSNIALAQRKNRIRRLNAMLFAHFAERIGVPSPLPLSVLQTSSHSVQSNSWQWDWAEILHEQWAELLLISQKVREEEVRAGRGTGYGAQSTSQVAKVFGLLYNWREKLEKVRLFFDSVMEDSLLLEFEHIRLRLHCMGTEFSMLPRNNTSQEAEQEGRNLLDTCSNVALNILEYVHDFANQGFLQECPSRIPLRGLSSLQFLSRCLKSNAGTAGITSALTEVEYMATLLSEQPLDAVSLRSFTSNLVKTVLPAIKCTLERLAMQNKQLSESYEADDREECIWASAMAALETSYFSLQSTANDLPVSLRSLKAQTFLDGLHQLELCGPASMPATPPMQCAWDDHFDDNNTEYVSAEVDGILPTPTSLDSADVEMRIDEDLRRFVEDFL